MDIHRLKDLFKWCTIINGALLILSVLGSVLMPDMAAKIHGNLFHISRDAISESIYMLLGMYKLFWISLNLVPYIALTIISRDG